MLRRFISDAIRMERNKPSGACVTQFQTCFCRCENCSVAPLKQLQFVGKPKVIQPNQKDQEIRRVGQTPRCFNFSSRTKHVAARAKKKLFMTRGVRNRERKSDRKPILLYLNKCPFLSGHWNKKDCEHQETWPNVHIFFLSLYCEARGRHGNVNNCVFWRVSQIFLLCLQWQSMGAFLVLDELLGLEEEHWC